MEGASAGATMCKAVHVVNDYHRPYDALTVQWQVVDGDGTVLDRRQHRLPHRRQRHRRGGRGGVADPGARRRAVCDPAAPWTPRISTCPATGTWSRCASADARIVTAGDAPDVAHRMDDPGRDLAQLPRPGIRPLAVS